MAWNDLKASVAAVIRTNGTQAITGTVLQSTLNSIIDQVGANSTFKGVATPSTNPGTPDGPLFYIAYEKGSYSNFGGISISEGDGLVILLYSGGWTKINIPVGLKDDILSTDFYLSGNNDSYLDNFIITDSKISIKRNGFSVIRKRDNKLMGYIGYIQGEDSSPTFELTPGTSTRVSYVIDTSVLNSSSWTSFSRAIKKFVNVTDGSISYPYIPLASFYQGKIIPCGLSSSLVSSFLVSTQIETRSDISETRSDILSTRQSSYNLRYNTYVDGMRIDGMKIYIKPTGFGIFYNNKLFYVADATFSRVNDYEFNLELIGETYAYLVLDESKLILENVRNELSEVIKVVPINLVKSTDIVLAVSSIQKGEVRLVGRFADYFAKYATDISETRSDISEIRSDISETRSDISEIRNSPPAGTLKLPVSYIPIYITCNDLNMSNQWGIGTRNKSVNIFLDHFFHTDRELNVVFENGSTFYTVTQSIKGEGDAWNGDWVKYEFQEELNVNEDMLKIKVRSILNSETSGIYPKVLQIGDSVTQGWFANYPRVNNAPVQSFSWAKYYFLKDAEQAGVNYKSLFVGRGSNTSFSYNGVSGTAYAEGKGGKTAKWFVTNPDSPFYAQNGFSLLSYLHKYKTLDIDGETRLVVGSTAGTEVTDVMSWDLCTPNVVVIQLGMNDVLSEWKTYMPQIVNSIKTEFPNMKVIISVLDGCTCNYPSLYPNYQNIFFDNYNNYHTKLMEAYCYALDNWQDEENGIYVLYSGMVMPMPMSCNVRETDGSFDGSIKRYIGVDSIERVPHPSRYAHQEIGYLLYSCIKWILS